MPMGVAHGCCGDVLAVIDVKTSGATSGDAFKSIHVTVLKFTTLFSNTQTCRLIVHERKPALIIRRPECSKRNCFAVATLAPSIEHVHHAHKPVSALQLPSAADGDHGPIARGCQLKHACMLGLLALHCRSDDEAKVLVRCAAP